MSNREPSSIDQSKTDTVGQDQDPSTSEQAKLDFTRTGSSELGRQLSLGSVTSVPQRIGLYRIVDLIGEGGMGAVCLAEQTEPIRRQVALKLIKGGNHCSAGIVARFEAERQALAMMDHPNIAKILDGGQSEEGIPFFAMELVKGVPLTEYCDAEKLTIRERLELFHSVCRAVHHAHQKGVIHRDLKPSNVLVAIHDDRPVAKVIDFGLAKAIDRTTILGSSSLETEFGQLLGTIRYMSPEQADLHRADIDTRTDIYSLGVILYELLTGTTPLEQATLEREAKLKLLELIRESSPQRPSDRLNTDQDSAIEASSSRQIGVSKLQSLLRGELDWIVMKALEIDRNRRYETANSFGEDIQRYLEGREVKARPPSTWYRLKKLIRQHSKVAATLGLIITTLVVATFFSVRSNLQAIEARNKEEAQKILALREKQAQETVTEIMQHVFDAGDPILGRLHSKYGSEFGQQASIAGVVRQVAEDEMGRYSRLKEFPVIRANLLNALGDICLSSGDVKFAQSVFLKSNSLLSEADALGGADYAKSTMALGTCDYLLGDLRTSKKRLHNFLDAVERLPGEEQRHPDVIRDKAFGSFVLAGIYFEEEDFEKTYLLLEQAAQTKVSGARDLPVLADLTRIMTTLVAAYEMKAKGEVSVLGIRKVLEFTVAGFWSFDVQDTLAGPFRGAVLAELASLFRFSPLPAYEKMHEELVAATSETHFLTLLPRFGMALAAERFERFDDALKHYQGVIDLGTATLGGQHPRFAMVLQRSANLRYQSWIDSKNRNSKELEKAREQCHDALNIRREKLGNHRLTVESLLAAAQMECAAENYRAASELLASAGQMQSELGLEASAELVLAKAQAEYGVGNFASAEATIRRYLEHRRSNPSWWIFGDQQVTDLEWWLSKSRFESKAWQHDHQELEELRKSVQRSVVRMRPLGVIPFQAWFQETPKPLKEAEELLEHLEDEIAAKKAGGTKAASVTP